MAGLNPGDVASRDGYGSLTRERLMDVGERLMARHGIYGVNLQRIRTEARVRNRSAINYHFGDRASLVRAIMHRHRAAIDEERHRLVDRLERRREVTVASLVEAGLAPLAASLTTESGRNFLIILSEVTLRTGSERAYTPSEPDSSSVVRVNEMLFERIGGSRARRRHRVGEFDLMGVILVADIARSVNRGNQSVAQGRRRVKELIGPLTAALVASS